jgi:ribosome biogenesis GTPase
VILFHKIDLACDETVVNLYRGAGYRVHCASSITRQGLADLRGGLAKKSSVLVGPSGVGKSTLVNCLCGQWVQSVNELSDKIQRGKQTTRFVQFFYAEDQTYLVDTPGYAMGKLPVGRHHLAERFPELKARYGSCRFNNCLHQSEPGCIIRTAVDDGQMAVSRYESYCQFLEEIKSNERKKY